MKGKYISSYKDWIFLLCLMKKSDAFTSSRVSQSTYFFRTPPLLSPFYSSNQYFIAASYIHTPPCRYSLYSASWSSIAFLFWTLPPRCLFSLKGIESHSLIVVKFLIPLPCGTFLFAYTSSWKRWGFFLVIFIHFLAWRLSHEAAQHSSGED